jgi:hypothetical protein
MPESPLSRVAGPVSLAAGALFAAVHLALFAVMDRTDLVAMTTDPLFRAVNIGYAAAFPLLLIALSALNARQANAAGTFGVVAFGAAVVGTVALAGDMWFEGLAIPWLAEVAPVVFTAEKSGTLLIGAVVSFLLFAAGWVLFGISCLRARVLPVGISLAIVLGGAIGFLAAMPPFGVPLGLAVAAAGGWLIRRPEQEGSPRSIAVAGAPVRRET